MQEVGPYTYEETWQREGVAWSEGDKQVKFKMNRTYFYRSDLSIGALDDVVTLPNVPFFVSS